jgi:hypothetical protein
VFRAKTGNPRGDHSLAAENRAKESGKTPGEPHSAAAISQDPARLDLSSLTMY